MYEVKVNNPQDLIYDPLLAQAIREIKSTYGVNVSVIDKEKSLSKFGRNTGVSTSPTTVMTFAGSELRESYVSDNLIDYVVSSKAADSTTVLTVEGHTISGNDLTFVTQTVTMNGQSSTALTTPLARVTRAFVSEGTEDLEGRVFVYEETELSGGVPIDTSKAHLTIPSGNNQSEKASTSLSSTDFWIVTNFYGCIFEKTAGFADVLLETRKVGSVFLQKERIAVNTGSGFSELNFNPYKVIPNNTDVRLTALGDAATSVGGGIQGYLAKII